MKVPRFDITQSFTFDAGHFIDGHDDRPGYATLHGHSFVCEVTLRGPRHPIHKWVLDFEDFEKALLFVREKLDHKMLNEIGGLSTPTMENISIFIARELRDALEHCGVWGPPLVIHKVKLMRPTIGEACIYRPDFGPIRTLPEGDPDQAHDMEFEDADG